mmetsp:Transcript_2622/g.3550  ORF Transcript_2622/g.3550 Transcript_2622/m.3550 type:complete len:497 (-) Transcript_2622:76-1566(-)
MSPILEKGGQVVEADHADDRDVVLVLHFLHGRGGALLPGLLLPVQRQAHAGRDAPRLVQVPHRLADGRAGRDHVVHDQHAPALHGRAHQRAALPVVLGLLPVVHEVLVDAIVRGKAHRHGRDQRDALVGGAEQHVELHAAAHDGLGVEPPEPQQRLARAEQPGVEEVRRHPAGLERELPEAQHLLLQRELDELLLVGQDGLAGRALLRLRNLLPPRGVDLLPEALGRRRLVRRPRDAPRDGHQQPAALGVQPRQAGRLQVAPLEPHPGREDPDGRRGGARAGERGSVRGADHQPDGVVRVPGGGDQRRHLLVQQPALLGEGQRLQVAGGGVGGLAQHEGPPPGPQEGAHAVEAHVRRERDRVRAQLVEGGGGVGLGGGGDVPALGVQQHRDLLGHRRDHPLHCSDPFCTQSFKESRIGFVTHSNRCCGIYDILAEVESTLGSFFFELAQMWVESNTQQRVNRLHAIPDSLEKGYRGFRRSHFGSAWNGEQDNTKSK